MLEFIIAAPFIRCGIFIFWGGTHKMRQITNQKTLQLVECGIMIGLSIALGFVRIFTMPLGGSITLCSMLPVMLISYRYGVKWGLACSFTYSVTHLLISMFVFGELLGWGISAQAIVGSIFLDYILAFTSLGLAGLFGTKYWQYMIGMTFSVFVRFVFHVFSGIIIFNSVPQNFPFKNALVYSVAYNGSFLLPELIICLIAGAVLYIPLKKYMHIQEKRAMPISDKKQA